MNKENDLHREYEVVGYIILRLLRAYNGLVRFLMRLQ